MLQFGFWLTTEEQNAIMQDAITVPVDRTQYRKTELWKRNINNVLFQKIFFVFIPAVPVGL